MTDLITKSQIHSWIDQELVETIDEIPDQHAEFNFIIEMSNIRIHVLRRQSTGPILIGQEIEYSEEISRSIQELSPTAQNKLVARIRETLAISPVVYGFQDHAGNNVRFQHMSRIFLEARIYPDALTQHRLMRDLVAVWKALRYLDDIVTLISSVDT